ncbi:MAG TPA: hypothetical protein VMD59_12845, partial [Acidimicrobiales bacterium]|nr:hypothetical protein [Acidimicrobiales bacterium]
MVRRRGVTAGPPLLLGIDIGTSLIKAVLVDATGAELALGQSPTPWLPCRSGAEGSAPAIFEAVLEAARAALAAHAAGAGRGGAAGRGSAARHVQVLAVGVIS